MPFNGGGGGALPPHEHTNIANDGGPLDFNNTTIGSMNAGDITFSDGAALQTLAYPGVPAGETLTAAALSTSPSWAAAPGGAATILVDSQELLVNTNNITSTFAAVNQSEISSIFAIINGVKDTTNTEIRCQINALTTGTYGSEFIQQYGAGYNQWAAAGATGWALISNNQGDEFFGEIKLSCNSVNDTIQAVWKGGTESNQSMGQHFNTTAAQTSFTEVKFYPTGGNFLAGTRLDVYKVEI